jgi:hypothetical protein
MRKRDEKATRIYTRCEVCGKIVPPEPGRELPDGWIAIETELPTNAPAAVCSTECQEQHRRK